jgi:ACS family glucarate transporter-like MFS transporter
MSKHPSSVRWRVMAILILASFVSYVLRGNLSIAPQSMMLDLGLSEVHWGWVMAAFPAGYAIFQFPGGLFADRIGPRKALTFIAIAWALLTLATAAVPGPEMASPLFIIASLMVIRFLVGAAHAPVFPTANSFIQRWFPVGGWAFPTGLSSTGLTLGFAATAPVLTWMILEIGWRSAFLWLAPSALVVAWLWWWYARDRPGEHVAVNAAEIALIEAGRPEPVAVGGAGPAWLRILRNRDVLLVMVSYSCMNFVFYDVFSWFFYYLANIRGYDQQTVGWVVSSQWIAGGVGAALGGWVCDRLCQRIGLRWGCRWPVIIGMTISGLLLIFGTLTSEPQLAVAAFVICFFFNQLTEAPYWATTIAVGAEHAGAAGGVMNTGANVMGVINALLVPFTAQALGWTFAMAMGGGFALLGAVLIFFVRADRRFDAP